MKRKSLARERGQIVTLAALAIPIVLGMAGMAVDVGSYASDRDTLQNAADAIALAAAHELPSVTNTNAAATTWAIKNNIDPANMQVIVTGGNSAPAVRVTISRNHEFAFIRAIGISNKDVGATAKAVKVSLGGGDDVVPWAVKNSTISSVPFGDEVVLKYDANGPSNGNFGPIRVDGSGSDDYQEAAMYGSDSTLCSLGTTVCTTAGCPGSFPSTCSENTPECDGPECPPKTGNMVGATRDAVDFRMTHTSAACDTFAETFTGPDSNGFYGLSPDCNPWTTGAGHCNTPTELCSRRVFIIPVINQYPNGSSTPVQVLKFALVYLEGYGNGKCQGNSCEVRARFVKAELTTDGLSGVYDQNALIQFIHLVE